MSDSMEDRIKALEDALRGIVDAYEASSELHTSSADCAANLYDRARAALAASQPAQPVAVKVKPLEWVEIRCNQYFEARVIGILYSVRVGSDGIVRWQAGHMGFWNNVETISTANDAAQADYEARIMAALDVQPLTVQDAAASDVLAERTRQISAEGWTPAHDDAHFDGAIARAAASYALSSAGYPHLGMDVWPWSRDWWKPAERRRDLVKAGALILAEIERLDSAALRAITEGRV